MCESTRAKAGAHNHECAWVMPSRSTSSFQQLTAVVMGPGLRRDDED
jgi:hypothetical protein